MFTINMCKRIFKDYMQAFKEKDMVVLFIFSFGTMAYGVFLVIYSFFLPLSYNKFYAIAGSVYIIQGIVGFVLSKSNKNIIAVKENWALYLGFMSLSIFNSGVGIYSLVALLPTTTTYEWESGLLFVSLILYFTSIIAHFTVIKIYFKIKPSSTGSNYVLVRIN